MFKKLYATPKLIDPKLPKPRPLVELPDGSLAVLLTKNRFATIDAEDGPSVGSRSWSPLGNGYVQGISNKNRILLHRFLMQPSQAFVVDHRDGNPMNNRRANLRVCSRAENMRNRGAPRSNASGFKGVSWNERDSCWRARIGHNGKHIYLGRFISEREAAQAYNLKALELFGPFAWLNPIDGEIDE